MKLKNKFILLVLILLPIFAFTALFAFSDYKQAVKETIAQQQFHMISTLADEIDSKLLTAQRDLIAVAKAAPPDIMQNPKKAQAFLDNKPILHTQFDNNVLLLTPSGQIFVESPYIFGRRGLDLSFREFMINTIKTNKPCISDPYVSTKPPRHPVVMLTVPIFDGKGKITGILGGSIDLMRDNFLGRLSTVKIGETGYLYLTATDGTLIMHPDKKRILTKVTPGANSLLDRAMEGFEGTDETTTTYGINMLASFKRMGAKSWILVANYPQAEAYRPIQVAEQYFLIVAIIAIIAVLLSLSLIAKYLIKPLEIFTRHVEDIPQKSGDDRFLNLQTNDEIGTLSLAFNKMVTEIDTRSELAEQADLSMRILNSTDSHMAVLGSDGSILTVNAAWRRFAEENSGGDENAWGTGSNYFVQYSEEWGDVAIAAEAYDGIRKVQNGQLPNFKIEYPCHSPSEKRWFRLSVMPLQGKEGTILVSHTNITERKLAEEEIRSVKRRLELAIQSGNFGIWDWDITNNIMVWDDRMLELYGLTAETFPGGIEAWQNGLHPQDRDRTIEECQAALRGEKEWNTEFRVLHPNGTVKHIKANGIVIRNSDGNPIRMLGINYDISDQRNLEAQFHHAQKMESIGILAGGVAHDFNNILMAIVSYGYMAQTMLKDDPTTQGYIEEILDSANRASELTRGLLAFSRKQVIVPVLVDLNEVVSNVEKMLSRIVGEDIVLNTALSSGELPIMVDVGQMEQVLMNLAANARDAMPDGGHLLIQTDAAYVDSHYAETHFFQNADKYAVLRVSDTGVGMDQGTKENIFEPFFTTKEVGKGTGLGLSMVYGIIKQHNGNIRVYSEVEKGTTFKIYLPMVQKKREVTSTPAIESLPGGNGETIIIAEDEPKVRESMVLILQGQDYKIIEAENGEDAVKKFKENRDAVSLLLLDVIMPVKNGKEAYEEIKGFDPAVKTIFMSGYNDHIVSQKGRLDEGFDVISKPINPDTLLRKIRDVLDR